MASFIEEIRLDVGVVRNPKVKGGIVEGVCANSRPKRVANNLENYGDLPVPSRLKM